jgi:hypothetical protein
MKHLQRFLAILAISYLPQFALAQTAQQTKMSSCNVQAQNLTGDARMDFLKSCLSSEPSSTSKCYSERRSWEMDKNSDALTVALDRCLADAEAASIKESSDKLSREIASAKASEVQKKKGGVSIGMTTQQVLASSWGKPNDIHRTTTATVSREQWIYGGRNYLYFVNGKLTAIQN